jgi:hypothetical protein
VVAVLAGALALVTLGAAPASAQTTPIGTAVDHRCVRFGPERYLDGRTYLQAAHCADLVVSDGRMFAAGQAFCISNYDEMYQCSGISQRVELYNYRTNTRVSSILHQCGYYASNGTPCAPGGTTANRNYFRGGEATNCDQHYTIVKTTIRLPRINYVVPGDPIYTSSERRPGC